MSTEVQTRRPNEVAVVREQLSAMENQFEAALPAHIPVERFNRVVLTAIQNNPDLLACNRKSLFNAAMKAAQDGLLPDGREGAIVPYKGEATWMPMIGGIRKKVRNSGDIASWDVHAVYENDHFEFELGDDPYIKHRPALSNKGKLIAVYSVAVLKGGEKSRDVMSVEDVEKIRALSRGKNTPWNNPTFYAEMAKKTVARRHSKVLPMSSDLDDLIRRDDALYDIQGASDAEVKAPRISMTQALDRLAAPTPVTAIQPDDTSADEAGPEETTSTSEGATAGADDGPAASAGDDFPGDQPTASGQPDFEAMIERFKANAPQAETIEELENAADELLPHMDGEALSRTQRELVQGIWEDNRKRIVERTTTPKAAAKKTGGVDPNDPDFKKGWADAERGATKCLKGEIRDNPERLAKWKAGFDAFHAQNAEG